MFVVLVPRAGRTGLSPPPEQPHLAGGGLLADRDRREQPAGSENGGRPHGKRARRYPRSARPRPPLLPQMRSEVQCRRAAPGCRAETIDGKRIPGKCGKFTMLAIAHGATTRVRPGALPQNFLAGPRPPVLIRAANRSSSWICVTRSGPAVSACLQADGACRASAPTPSAFWLPRIPLGNVRVLPENG